jgi:hypothetical protein
MPSGPPLLLEALEGNLDGRPVSILDIDDTGAIVEHSILQLTSPPSYRLQFRFEHEVIDVDCVVVSSLLQDLLSDQRQRITFHARVDFEPGADLTALHRALSSYRSRLERLHLANLDGESGPEPPSVTMLRAGSAVRGRKPGYLVCVYRDGKWTERESRNPEQPFDGFTVGEFEDAQQIVLLRKAYEEADRAGRDLIRQFAAASLERDGAPPPISPAE